MSVEWFALNHENDVCIDVLIDDLPLILDEGVSGLVRDFVDFHFTDVKNTYVIQPFATIESSEDEELLGPDHTCCMSLSTNRRFVNLDRMTPPHGLSVQNIKIIRWNDLLQATTTSIVASKQVDLSADQTCSMPSQTLGWAAVDSRL